MIRKIIKWISVPDISQEMGIDGAKDAFSNKPYNPNTRQYIGHPLFEIRSTERIKKVERRGRESYKSNYDSSNNIKNIINYGGFQMGIDNQGRSEYNNENRIEFITKRPREEYANKNKLVSNKISKNIVDINNTTKNKIIDILTNNNKGNNTMGSSKIIADIGSLEDLVKQLSNFKNELHQNTQNVVSHINGLQAENWDDVQYTEFVESYNRNINNRLDTLLTSLVEQDMIPTVQGHIEKLNKIQNIHVGV